MSSLRAAGKLFCVFVFLLLTSLWSIAGAAVYMNSRWMPKSFFRFEQEKYAHMENSLSYANVFESALFSAVALLGYVEVKNGGRGLFASETVYEKYLWLCLTPWLITFARGWVINTWSLLRNARTMLEATNFCVFTCLWIADVIAQLLLWSEVFCVALQGWILMKNADYKIAGFK